MDAVKKERRIRERKHTILNDALKIFCQKGLKETTIDDICESANLSHGLFYHYFKSKQDLYNGLSEIFDKSILEHYNEVINSDTSPDVKLKEIISYTFSNLSENENFAYKIYFIISQMIRAKDEENVYIPLDVKRNVKKIVIELDNLFNDGIKQNYFESNKTASEYSSMLLNILIGITMTSLLPTDTLRNACMLNPTLTYSIFLKK